MANISGNSGNNRLTGTGASDRVLGLGGNDWISGLAGNDTISGGTGNDTGIGGSGNDLLFGGAGSDQLFGGAGRDTIVGGTGRDHLYGGAGADTFRFDDPDAGDATAGPLSDVIYDFTEDDILDLREVDVLFANFLGSSPSRGGLSVWEAGGSTFVSWNTFNDVHDVELRGYTAEGNIFDQVRWYDDDNVGGMDTTARLDVGTTKIGELEVAEDDDFFRVNLKAGELSIVSVEGTGSIPARFPFVQLFDADGNSLAFGDENFPLRFVAETSGTYFVQVDSGSSAGTGSYEVSLRSRAFDDVPSDFGTDATIVAGQTVNGEFELPFDVDTYRLDARGGRLYTFTADGAPSIDGSASDLHFFIFDEFGNFLLESDLNGDPSRARLATESAGTFFVEVHSDAGEGTGSYKLTLNARAYQDDFGGDFSTLGSLDPGDTQAAEIGTSIDEDWFRVSLTAGETYTFEMKGQSSGSGNLVDPYLYLLDEFGNFMDDDIDSGIGLDARMNFTAGATGDYFLVARDETGGGFGTYTVSMQGDDPLAA
jgi:hypothetical protein